MRNKLLPFLFLAFCAGVSCICGAQSQPNIPQAPNPAYVPEPYGLFVEGIRSVTKVVTSVDRGILDDTTLIFNYSRQGVMTKTTFREGNKPISLTYSNIVFEGEPFVWPTYDPNFKKPQYFSSYVFDQNKNQLSYHNYKIDHGDTTLRRRDEMIYDEGHRVISYKINNIERPSTTQEYEYIDDVLKRSLKYTSNIDYPNTNIQVTTYTYQPDGSLARMETSAKRGKVDTCITSEEFSYDDNRLIKKKSTNIDVRYKEWVDDYAYDKEGRLAQWTTAHDSIFTRIDYEYKKGVLSGSTITTKDKGMHGRYYGYIDFFPDKPGQQHVVKEKYYYDAHDNLIKSEGYYEGKMAYRVVYELEYY